jgi:hypothetical protein
MEEECAREMVVKRDTHTEREREKEENYSQLGARLAWISPDARAQALRLRDCIRDAGADFFIASQHAPSGTSAPRAKVSRTSSPRGDAAFISERSRSPVDIV